jgi:hypothetical protein
VPEKIAELSAFLTSLRYRMGKEGDAVQEYRAEIFAEILEDYEKSLRQHKERSDDHVS